MRRLRASRPLKSPLPVRQQPQWLRRDGVCTLGRKLQWLALMELVKLIPKHLASE